MDSLYLCYSSVPVPRLNIARCEMCQWISFLLFPLFFVCIVWSKILRVGVRQVPTFIFL